MSFFSAVFPASIAYRMMPEPFGHHSKCPLGYLLRHFKSFPGVMEADNPVIHIPFGWTSRAKFCMKSSRLPGAKTREYTGKAQPRWFHVEPRSSPILSRLWSEPGPKRHQARVEEFSPVHKSINYKDRTSKVQTIHLRVRRRTYHGSQSLPYTRSFAFAVNASTSVSDG